MTKKAQFEIMGIAVLVVIIMLGMLIFFVLSQSSREENIVKQYSNAEFAQGFLEVLLKTNVNECKGYYMEELIRDCASTNQISCTTSGDKDSCEKAEDTAKAMLDGTLKKYNKGYSFKAVKIVNQNEEELFPKIQQGSACIEKERPGRQPLAPNIVLSLEICG